MILPIIIWIMQQAVEADDFAWKESAADKTAMDAAEEKPVYDNTVSFLIEFRK